MYRVARWGAALTVAVSFAACGGDDDAEPAAPTTTASVPAADGELDADRATSEIRPGDDGSVTAYTDIVIAAPADEVWAVLTDFDAMSAWSSTFVGLTGDLVDGGSATARYVVNGDTLEFPRTISWQAGRSFGWSDEVSFAPGIVDDHRFVIESTDGTNTLFVQVDTFSGSNDESAPIDVANDLIGGYATFNRELEAEVESRSG